MAEHPFASCWLRVDRAQAHRHAAAQVWNDFLESEPYDTVLDYEGQGQFVIRVIQQEPTPPEMSVLIGEWLYNLRCALDYIVYETAVCVSGENPPPGEGVLQFPIYDSPDVYAKNLYRLKPLADHHRLWLESVQPYRHQDPDTSALRWLNHLARIDRHRRLSVVTAYVAEASPVISVPPGCEVVIEFADSVVVDYEAEVARFTVTPWQDDWKPNVKPGVGIDPEIAEWAVSPFWRQIPYNERLRRLDIGVVIQLAAYEYDCTGGGRKAELLTNEFRAECDARRQPRG